MTVEEPNSQRSGKFIIHQLSDLMFNSETSESGPWKSYLDELARLKEDAKDPEKDNRPDMVVFCGGTIGLTVADEDEDGLSLHKYRETLYAARLELDKMVSFYGRKAMT